jgi:transcriptional regulator with XRE-family HTH domain
VLGRLLRDNGVQAQDIAERLGWSPAHMSRLLHGRCRVSPTDVATVLALCGVSSGALRALLLELAGDLMSPTWLQEHGERLPVELPAVRELEESAVSIVCVDGTAVPALLQASGYLSAVQRSSPVVPRAEVARRVAARVERQQVLERVAPPLTFEAFVGVQALSRNGFGSGFGEGPGEAALAEQVRHLSWLSATPSVRIRLVPQDSPVRSLCTPFQLMRFAEAAPVVYVEHLNSTLLSQRPATIAGYQRILALLDESALGVEESLAVLTEMAGHGGRP